ncbi:RNase adapter RapZ [Chitinophagaceae bacterium 26-R-25]|nr:RNase adapter RapZ [Chitinophagaceae bacterium 26-R-25]
MQKVIEEIKALAETAFGVSGVEVEVLPQSGSDRRYFRVFVNGKSYIACYGPNVQENKTFISFTNQFRKHSVPVPEIHAINDRSDIYILEDFGTVSLLDELEKNKYNSYVYDLFKKSLRSLARLQVVAGEGIDYNMCLTAKEFGKQAILSDLLYFKYYFLDTLKYPYDKQALLNDFESLTEYLTRQIDQHFMFRDFQSRNIMIKDGEVYFIDYQGGMKGALQYDVASLLWQAKAELPEDWKNELLDYYIDEVNQLLTESINKEKFVYQYNGYVLIRLLQVLGAYGFRGLFERKAHFLSSIPQAINNLKWFLDNKQMGIVLPELEKCLRHCVSDEVLKRFEPIRASEDAALVVKISSFSFKQGIPGDETENGGGFVFDCRGILNPGRFQEYKTLTGRDKPVKDFLEQQTMMPEFLNSVYNIVDISVTDYLKRDFESLMVSFGCTGGQHRSVYAADALARHLKNKFNVKVEVVHHVQDAKNWIN